jgi:hypothetical protein
MTTNLVACCSLEPQVADEVDQPGNEQLAEDGIDDAVATDVAAKLVAGAAVWDEGAAGSRHSREDDNRELPTLTSGLQQQRTAASAVASLLSSSNKPAALGGQAGQEGRQLMRRNLFWQLTDSAASALHTLQHHYVTAQRQQTWIQRLLAAISHT